MIKEIRANARTSFKQQTVIGDVFYTFEYGETRQDDYDSVEKYEQDKALLWQQVNNEVNKQIQETLKKYQIQQKEN
jgi:hypothetical protein